MEQFDLSDFFQTRSQATDFSTRLSAISEELYETHFDLEKALLKQFGIQKKDKFIALLRDNTIDMGSNSALKAFFTKIQDMISALPTISLTVAIDPDEKIIKSMSDWVLIHLKKQVIFDIQVNPNLIGGAIITYNGRYEDFSVKPIFDQVIRDEVLINRAAKYTPINYSKYNATDLKEYFKNTRYPLVN